MSTTIMILFYGVLQLAILLAPASACEVKEVIGCLRQHRGLQDASKILGTKSYGHDTLCKCVEDYAHRCPPDNSTTSVYLEHAANVICKLNLDLHRNKVNRIGHVIVKRGWGGRCSTPGLRTCINNYEDGVASNPTDMVHTCGLIVTFLTCMKRNTEGCPSEYERLVGIIRDSLNRVQETCGFNICIPRYCTPVTPSWFQTCNIKAAIACVSDYHGHLKQLILETRSRNESVILNAYRRLADYKTACGHLNNATQIESCVDSAMSTCTKPSIVREYHQAIVKLAGFCQQATACSRFNEAVTNIQNCYVERINALVDDDDVTADTIACRFAVAALKCQHDHLAVCPAAQNYMKDNLLLGTGTGEFADDCSHYILPWEEGFHAAHPTRRTTRSGITGTMIRTTPPPVVCSIPGQDACVRQYSRGVARNPTDAVHTCGLIVTLLSCMKGNTTACTYRYDQWVGRIRAQLFRVQENCGFDICIPRQCIATTPSWFRTCDTRRAIACVSEYHIHLRSINSDLNSQETSVILEAYRKLADYKTACGYLKNPRVIEGCVDSAMSTCTNTAVKFQYHTAVVKLLGFCEQAKDCDSFAEAVENIKSCYVRRIRELVADPRVTRETIACRFAVAALKCQHDNFAVCPLAQAYIENNLLLGTAAGQFEDDCEHYILPWQEGFHTGHPTLGPFDRRTRPSVSPTSFIQGISHFTRDKISFTKATKVPPTAKPKALVQRTSRGYGIVTPTRHAGAVPSTAPVTLMLAACLFFTYYNL